MGRVIQYVPEKHRQTDRQTDIFIRPNRKKYNDRYIIENWSGDLH